MARRDLKSSEQGFTLVEVLVALTVFAIAGVGLMQLSASHTRALSSLQMRALAEVEANNQIVESFLLEPRALIVGVETGDAVQRGQALIWTRTTEETEWPSVFRITVGVADPATEQVLASLTVLRHRDET